MHTDAHALTHTYTDTKWGAEWSWIVNKAISSFVSFFIFSSSFFSFFFFSTHVKEKRHYVHKMTHKMKNTLIYTVVTLDIFLTCAASLRWHKWFTETSQSLNRSHAWPSIIMTSRALLATTLPPFLPGTLTRNAPHAHYVCCILVFFEN